MKLEFANILFGAGALALLTMSSAGAQQAQTSSDNHSGSTPSALADTTSAAIPGQHYTTDATPLGVLLDDPAARAVLNQHIPTIINNDQISMARSMTLKGIQPYSPELTDATLAAIDVDLGKLPLK